MKRLLSFLEQYINPIIILSSIFIILIREVDLFTSPRFWAEEGTISYAFSRHHSITEIIFAIHNGYLTMLNGLISIIQSRMIPIENAPTLTLIISSIIQLLPVYLVISTNNFIWDRPLKKTIALLLILIIPPEIWLTTTGSHFILSASCILIFLISPNEINKAQKWIFRTTLIIGTLAGPTLVFLAPSILYKCIIDKNKERYIQGMIVLTLCLLQGSIMIHEILSSGTGRLNLVSLNVLVKAFARDHFTLGIRDYGVLSGILAIIIFTFLIVLFIKKFQNSNYRFLFSLLFSYSVLSTLGSLEMSGAQRYGYISAFIIVILFFNFYFTFIQFRNKITKTVVLSFFFMLLSIGIINFQSKMLGFAYNENYPKWSEEILKWKNNSE